MTATLTTAAGKLARDLCAVRDYAERLRAAAAICSILAAALDDGDHGTDVACPLMDAAANAEHNAAALEERNLGVAA